MRVANSAILVAVAALLSVPGLAPAGSMPVLMQMKDAAPRHLAPVGFFWWDAPVDPAVALDINRAAIANQYYTSPPGYFYPYNAPYPLVPFWHPPDGDYGPSWRAYAPYAVVPLGGEVVVRQRVTRKGHAAARACASANPAVPACRRR